MKVDLMKAYIRDIYESPILTTRGVDMKNDRVRGHTYVGALGFCDEQGLVEWCKGKKILDLGSGEGNFAYDLKKKGIDTSVVGLEPALHLIPELRQKIKQKEIMTVSGDWKSLPFGGETFDAVVSCYGFPLYEDSLNRMKVLGEIYQVLKMGGEFRFGPMALVDDPIMTFNSVIAQTNYKKTANFSIRSSGQGLILRKIPIEANKNEYLQRLYD